MVPSQNIGEAIKQTILFVIPGQWRFEIAPHQWNKPNDATRVSAVHYNPKGRFWINIFAILEQPIAQYDSIKGDTGMRIDASIYHIVAKQKPPETPPIRIAEDKTLRTPLAVAQWIKTTLDGFGDDDENGGDFSPTPDPTLVGAA